MMSQQRLNEELRSMHGQGMSHISYELNQLSLCHVGICIRRKRSEIYNF